MTQSRRLIVVSNRLPVTVSHADGKPDLRTSSGGLVTALNAVCREHSAYWVGWTGTDHSPEIETCVRNAQPGHFRMVPVFLSPEEQIQFYRGFSNEIVWPLFHDLQSRCNFQPSYWDAYLSVNERFAGEIASIARPDDFIWVHDYHLVRIARYLRERGVTSRLAFFQHIPFPSLDIFEKMPWREEFLESILRFDVVGFQTDRDRRNFIACARHLLSDFTVKRRGQHFAVSYAGQSTTIGTFPISIDFHEFAAPSTHHEVSRIAERLRRGFGDRRIILGVDRLDYTKGLPEKLRAFRTALELYPDLRRNVSLVQLVVPSREDIPKYDELKHEVEWLVSEINGQFTDAGWVPIHFMYRHLERPELLAYYQIADVGLVTPLKDGMNLVAKEFCAAQVESPGVLVLSEFAGSAVQLKPGAVIVNPNDAQGVANAIYAALRMAPSEQAIRMQRLRDIIRHEDVHRWTAEFMSASVPALLRKPRSGYFSNPEAIRRVV
jgi:trehalose 6-phosphate synthase/phosphatase